MLNDVKAEGLSSLIPHKGKMLLLSRVFDYNLTERTIVAEYDINEDCLFYNTAIEGVPAYVGFEFMAQAIAAMSGLDGLVKGTKPKIGFILSVSSIMIEIPFFKAGSTVEIRMKETEVMDNILKYKGIIFLEDRIAMEGELMVMHVVNNEQLAINN